MAIASINPTTGETIKTFEPLTPAVVQSKVAIAAETFVAYRQIPLTQRAEWMQAAARELDAGKAKYGELMTLEMGKPLAAAVAEVEKCAWVCRYYAEHAAGFLAEETIATDAQFSGVRYEPLGPVLAVMPWNFPFWQVFRFAAPSLMAGNVGLLKHASNVPQCALAIEDIFRAAGFPDGVFQTLLIGASQVADLMADDRVKAATLTGSEPAGASLAMAAGQHIKKVVLELGGSDPFIILPSANLEQAVTTAVKARMLNNGQSCIAAKRFILVGDTSSTVEPLLLERFRALQMGDPLQPDTDIGPLATPTIQQELHQQVQAALQAGGKALIGGTLPDRPGNFYPPTLLVDVPTDHPIAQEEFFGPVAMVFRVGTLEDAIALANATPFGLGASAWTCDPAEQAQLLRELAAGAVFINGMVKSDPRLPFGGIKRSGFGRELGRPGILEFVNQKTVWVG